MCIYALFVVSLEVSLGSSSHALLYRRWLRVCVPRLCSYGLKTSPMCASLNPLLLHLSTAHGEVGHTQGLPWSTPCPLLRTSHQGASVEVGFGTIWSSYASHQARELGHSICHVFDRFSSSQVWGGNEWSPRCCHHSIHCSGRGGHHGSYFFFLVFLSLVSARGIWLEMVCPWCLESVDVTQRHFIICSRERDGIMVQLRYHILCWQFHAYLNNVEWINWGMSC